MDDAFKFILNNGGLTAEAATHTPEKMGSARAV
jgi:hypothetical protein